MALKEELIKEFAKLTKPEQKETKTTIYGPYTKINGKDYVRFDGSNIYTPVDKTVDAKDNDRVIVDIEKHKAIMRSNVTDPSARTTVLNNLSSTVDEHGNSIQSINTNIQSLDTTVVALNTTVNTFDSRIQVSESAITTVQSDITSINSSISSTNSRIDTTNAKVSALDTDVILLASDVTSLSTTVNLNESWIEANSSIVEANNSWITTNSSIVSTTASTVTTHASQINILNSGFSIVNNELKGLSSIIVNDLKTNHLNATYADIDFSNIQYAAVEKLFTESGIIKDLVVDQGHITGELVGVTLKGDLIEGNTVKADKLVVLGEDGLYYKLNVNAVGETQASSDPIYQSQLHGDNIIANSITAEKIDVNDLVAFNATIGGFDITNSAIHTPTKTSISNDSMGLYFDKTGQLYLGDANSHLKYYKDTSNNWVLDIVADDINITGRNTSLMDDLNTVDMLSDIPEQLKDITETQNLDGDAINALNNYILGNGIYSGVAAPPNHDVLWLDTTNNTVKKWVTNQWVAVENSSIINRIIQSEAKLDIHSNKIVMEFNDVEERTDYINNIQQSLTYYNVSASNIEFTNRGIELSRRGSDFSLIIQNNSIDIMYLDAPVSSWDQNTFNSDDITTETLNMKEPNNTYCFKWVFLQNGSMSLRKVVY